MKIKITFLLLFLTLECLTAQIIDIPDANFKNALVNDNVAFIGGSNGLTDVDTNNDGEIQLNEALAVSFLNISNKNITSLEGIQHFSNVTDFYARHNNIVDLDLSFLTSIGDLLLDNNPMESLDLSNLVNADIIKVYETNLIDLNLESLESVQILEGGNGPLGTVNLDALIHADYLYFPLGNLSELNISALEYCQKISLEGNPVIDLDVSSVIESPNGILYLDLISTPIETLNLKNGLEEYLQLEGSVNLSFICADANQLDDIQNVLTQYSINNCLVNNYCSFTPGGDYYIVEGVTRFDMNLDGCDVNDNLYSSLKFSIGNGITEEIYTADSTGHYNISVNEGSYTFTPLFDNPNYYSISPSVVTLNFPSDGSLYNQDFCLTPNGIYNDLEVFIVPITDAVPGFDSEYKIVYRNVGNTVLSGTLDFDFSFDSDYMQYLSSVPSENGHVNNILSWDYIDLVPFETREIVATFNLNTPTDTNFPLNADHELNFEVLISSNAIDETPDNNDFGLKQIVVNSFDPNDIRCLEGENILPERVGEYVHYLIRFENLGTANATNIVIKNTIDATKFDVNSLAPLNGSHEYYTRINTENEVEFIFENINLPFDDANNDGYVLYKIKTLESLVLGDTFSNQAEIYFDFNAPIITNTYTTEVSEEQLSTNEFTKLNTRVHPNPVTDFLSIKSDTVIESTTMYDINGRVMLSTNVDTNTYKLDLSQLKAGLYFLKVFSNSKSETLKIVKR
ncbi:T9SS type A sorting domain-containing protein [uncultured Psychroserpens sp.]|uniref:DUF7619 domain-containing protein n=1 Tax=uncultured Psychroserpens sp. TaxID=255436 RepID=UPI0026174AC1|nr:T9SS type A sorting domain-containing protein [uncultured Psychroserpens sp.]